MKLRADTILASFVVALFSSFLTALAVLLVQISAASVIKNEILGTLIFNIYILFFLAGVVFFKGSSLAAWLLYRHDVTWGYKLEYKKILPIFFTALGMAAAVFFAVYFYIQSELDLLQYLEQSRQALRSVRP